MNAPTLSPTAGLRDYIDAISRRRRLLIAVSLSILVLGLLIAAILPSVYRSEAVILIEQQEIPSELVRSTVTSFAAQRIQVISQRVMTSANLLNIIQKFGLYEEESKTEPRESILQTMRDDISLEMISADVVDPKSGRPTEATIAFKIAFESTSPGLAQKVANELVSLYLNENIKNRTEIATETATFLADEATRLGKDVRELEARLAEFKGSNVESRPELEQMTRSILSRTDLEIAEVDRRASVAAQQKVYLEGELAQLEPYRSSDTRSAMSPMSRLQAAEAELAAAEAAYSPEHPDVIRARRQVAAIRAEVDPAAAREIYTRQLEAAKEELASLIERYGPDHPDVVTANRRVDAAKTRLASVPDDADPVPDNAAYAALKARLEAVNAEIVSLERKRDLLSAKYDQAFENLSRIPEAEAQYLALQRQYESTVAKHREVLAKQMEARLSQNLEEGRKGERFTLIEPPLMPEQPASPNRAAIATISLVLALAAGFGVIGVAEMLDTRVRGRKGIQELLSAPPLASIPYIPDGSPPDWFSTPSMKFAVALALFAVAVVAVHFSYKPLDVLWFIVLRHLGI